MLLEAWRGRTGWYGSSVLTFRYDSLVDPLDGFFLEWRLAYQHRVPVRDSRAERRQHADQVDADSHDHSQAPNIHLVRMSTFGDQDFRCDIVWRPTHGPLRGFADKRPGVRSKHRSATDPDSLSSIAILVQQRGQPEIPDLAAQPLVPLVRHKDVAELEIPMHDPRFVHVHDGRDELDHVDPRFGFGKVASFPQEAHHVLPVARRVSEVSFVDAVCGLDLRGDSLLRHILPGTGRCSGRPGTYC